MSGSGSEETTETAATSASTTTDAGTTTGVDASTAAVAATSSGGASVSIDCLDVDVGAVDATFEHPLVGVVPAEGTTVEATGLPDGVTLDETGVAHGKPTQAGDFDVELVATAREGETATVTCPITINDKLAIDPSIDPLGDDYCLTIGQSLLDRLAPDTGDGTPIACEYQPGALAGHMPAGLAVDPDTCELTGEVAETRFGAFAFIVVARQSGARIHVPYCAGQPEANFAYTIEVAHGPIAPATTLPIVRVFQPRSTLSFYTLGDPHITVTDPGACGGAGCNGSATWRIGPQAGFDLGTLDLVNLEIVDDMGTPIGIEHDIFMTGPAVPVNLQDRPWVFQMSLTYCLGATPADCSDQASAGGHVELPIVMVPA